MVRTDDSSEGKVKVRMDSIDMGKIIVPIVVAIVIGAGSIMWNTYTGQQGLATKIELITQEFGQRVTSLEHKVEKLSDKLDK